MSSDLATLADTGAVVDHGAAGGPDAALGVEADAVRAHAVGPDAPTRQRAVLGDVEGGQPGRERLGDDEGLVVGRDDHPVRECDLVRHLQDVTIRRDERDLSWRLPAREDGLEVGEVEVERVDVDVAASVDGHLAPAVRREVAQIGMPDRSRRARRGPAHCR